MKYSIQIQRALQKAVDALGDYGQKKFAEKSQINPVYINRWLNPGKYNPKTIGDALWKKLLPHISPYLTEDAESIPASKKSIKQQFHSSSSPFPLPIPAAAKPEYVGKIINGQINVYGVPNERISSAINAATFLTEEEKRLLIYEIFKEG